MTRSVLTDGQRRARRARRTLAGRGLVEAVTWSFIPQDQAEHFGGGADASETRQSDFCRTFHDAARTSRRAARCRRNATATAASRMSRCSSLARPISTTRRKGRCSLPPASGSADRNSAAAAVTGAAMPNQTDVFDVKADAAALLARARSRCHESAGHARRARLVPSGQVGRDHGSGRRSCWRISARSIRPRCKLLDIDGPAAGVRSLPACDCRPKRRKARARAPLNASDLLPVTRDFAFVVDKSTEAGAMIRAAAGAEKGADQRTFRSSTCSRASRLAMPRSPSRSR